MDSWPVPNELRAWWRRWGLSIEDLDRPHHYPWYQRLSTEEVREAARQHTLVASYLDRHPEAAARWRSDQRGELRYPQVLALAEAEARADQANAEAIVP
jgi:hypothetical protein